MTDHLYNRQKQAYDTYVHREGRPPNPRFMPRPERGNLKSLQYFPTAYSFMGVTPFPAVSLNPKSSTFEIQHVVWCRSCVGSKRRGRGRAIQAPSITTINMQERERIIKAETKWAMMAFSEAEFWVHF